MSMTNISNISNIRGTGGNPTAIWRTGGFGRRREILELIHETRRVQGKPTHESPNALACTSSSPTTITIDDLAMEGIVIEGALTITVTGTTQTRTVQNGESWTWAGLEKGEEATMTPKGKTTWLEVTENSHLQRADLCPYQCRDEECGWSHKHTR